MAVPCFVVQSFNSTCSYNFLRALCFLFCFVLFCFLYYSLRLAEDVVFAALKVCVKESCNMILQCSNMEDEAFHSLVAKHPVSHYIYYFIIN